ncbi:MAG: pyruvate kinase [Lachnospiraceae bacterium]|nr:pyruvate kinase [Lachnospiraceae bacterium]MDY3223519.1 pyruvate kinase [Lachnospiraceae bacterium]
MRKTKIICTIGPASQSPEKIREMILAGMNVCRCNFSHGSYEEQKAKLINVVRISEELGIPVATLLDTKGPEIRLRTFAEGKTQLEAGQQFTLTTKEVEGSDKIVSVTYKNIVNDVKKGGCVLLDDGLIELRVEDITDTDLICRVINGGPISDKKGVNLPGANLSMPFISEQDRRDIIFGAEVGFDFIAASFVRCKDDILEVKKILEEKKSPIKVIAKIENMQGIENLDEILEAADGIMVARGDMGVEVPMEEVPVIQKMMIKKAVAMGKHVITATQMLESMTKNPRPTRAETTDVANAIYDGTTAIMLSGESASGKYPVEALKTMAKIAERTEKDIHYNERMKKLCSDGETDITTAISHATCTTAADLKASAIITVTMSGFTANMVSRFKPECPIIACSVNPRVCRQSSLLWGVTPLLIEKKDNTDDLFKEAIWASQKAGLIKEGDTVILTAGVPLGISGKTNMIRVIEV